MIEQVTGDVILMGPPGSGKGTQAKLLTAIPGWTHLSTGDLFRKHLKEGTSLGKLAEQYIARGVYVPDDITVNMVCERLGEITDGERILFDGFPRTVPQAEALDRLLGERDRAIARVVLIVCPDDELARRLAKRGQGRADDSPDVVRKRLVVYEEQTKPVVDFYERAGVVRRVDGVGDVQDVSARLTQAIA